MSTFWMRACHILKNYFNKIDPIWWVLFGIAIATVVYVGYKFYPANSKQTKRLFLYLIIGLHLVFVLLITILSRKRLAVDSLRDLIIFDLGRAFHIQPGIYGIYDTAIENTLNVLLLFPIGIYIAVFNCASLRKVTGIGFLLSLTIEVLQLVTRRGYFEIDDILLNTLGVIIGYLLIKFFQRLSKHRKEP